MSLANSPIGGQLISSFGAGFAFLPFQGLLPPAGSPPPQGNWSVLDVERSQLVREVPPDDTTHTGSWGASGANVSSARWRARARLKWDLRNSPDPLVKYGTLRDPTVFDLGYQVWFFVGSGANYASDLLPLYYYSPSAKGSLIQPIVDAVSKPTPMVACEIEIVGNAPLFLFGGPASEQAQYDAYITHCLTRNWVW